LRGSSRRTSPERRPCRPDIAGLSVVLWDRQPRAIERKNKAVASAPTPGRHGILSDVNMPGSIDGLELARRVRKHRSNIGIVVVSGRARKAGELPVGAIFIPKSRVATRTFIEQVSELAARALTKGEAVSALPRIVPKQQCLTSGKVRRLRSFARRPNGYGIRSGVSIELVQAGTIRSILLRVPTVARRTSASHVHQWARLSDPRPAFV
jgi:CheY-like chemotaxis protein